MVLIHLPGGGEHPVTPDPIYDAIPAGTPLIRIYDPDDYGHPVRFKHFGPTARFDHHRHPHAAPDHDPDRGVYYAAFALDVCVTEVFGDTRVVECSNRRVVTVTVGRALRLVDLRGAGAMRVGSVAALCATADRPLSQAWARYLYEHPAIHPATDGLICASAHNGGDAVVLFERAAGSLSHGPGDDERLDHPYFRPDLERIAREHNLIVKYP